MLVNSYGDAKFCDGNKCAWWDDAQRQCAVKTFLLNNTGSNIYDRNKDNHIVLGDKE